MLPIGVSKEEMSKHIEGSIWLIRRHHVPSLVDHHEPKIARHLHPASNLSINSPYLLASPFPLGSADPVQSIQVSQHTSCVHHEVLLSIVDEHLHVVKSCGHIGRIAAGDVIGK